MHPPLIHLVNVCLGSVWQQKLLFEDVVELQRAEDASVQILLSPLCSCGYSRGQDMFQEVVMNMMTWNLLSFLLQK